MDINKIYDVNGNSSYLDVLSKAQSYMPQFGIDTENITKENTFLFKKTLESFIADNKIKCSGYQNVSSLVSDLFDSMVYYDILTKYLEPQTIKDMGIEEIYGQWDCIFLRTKQGIVKLDKAFPSPQMATDIINRIARKSATSKEINTGTPVSLGEFTTNIRFGAVAEPIVPKSTGVSFAIRIVDTQSMTKKNMLKYNTATEDMLDFMVMCATYGVNICIAGKVGSGKTGTLSYILSEIKNTTDLRIGTIEHESRELDPFIYDDEGHVINNAFSWTTRPSDDARNNIDGNMLLATMLRFSADLVAFGEMRDKETMSVVDAGNTGQGIMATTHSNSAKSAYTRMVTLCKKALIPYDDATLFNMALEAFPIICYQRQLIDRSRKIVEIVEGMEYKNGKVIVNPLFRYEINKSYVKDGKQIIDGGFKKVGSISHDLKQRLLQEGVSSKLVEKFC